jgi:thiol-disulfide isomerase/thioredoxin
MKSIHLVRGGLIAGLVSAVVLCLGAGGVPPAAVSAGQKVLPFEAKATDGSAVKFPDGYKGKVVLLDFWATWCGPCVAEMPNVIAAYDKYHSKGFEILGVSLDQEKADAKLAAFTKEHKMPWLEIYDGKYWKADIAVKYNINSIPHAFLVDGDTGMIIADGGGIRGQNLEPAIEKALAKKAAK